MENIKDTSVETEKVENTTPQDEIDNAVASAKARWNKKLEKDYVSVDKYNEVVAQLTQAQNELKLPNIEKAFVNAGGKKEAFKSFVKLTPSVFDAKDEKEISVILDQAKKDMGFMFNSQTFNASVGGTATNNNNTDYSNGSLLRTK